MRYHRALERRFPGLRLRSRHSENRGFASLQPRPPDRFPKVLNNAAVQLATSSTRPGTVIAVISTVVYFWRWPVWRRIFLRRL